MTTPIKPKIPLARNGVGEYAATFPRKLTLEVAIEDLTREVRALRRDLELQRHPLALTPAELRWALPRPLGSMEPSGPVQDYDQDRYEMRCKGYVLLVDPNPPNHEMIP